MAEDEIRSEETLMSETDYEDESEAESEERVCRPRGKPCNSRIDELAMPSKRLLLSTFRQYGYLFEKDRNRKLKQLLAIYYALSLEETKKYFDQVKKLKKQKALKRKFKRKLKELLAERKRREKKLKAYITFKKIVKFGLQQALLQDIPSFMSARLRNLSDVILVQLAELRGVSVPDKEDPDALGFFLMCVANWIALTVENMYYQIVVRKNEELEAIERDEMLKIEEENRNQIQEGSGVANE